jgi:Na+/H+ antiporter NhaA
MSTDTAFALGTLALVGRGFPASLRTFLLTMAVADDLVAFVVIAVVYTHGVSLVPLLIATGALGLMLVARLARVRNGVVYLALGLLAWAATLKAGVDPVVVGVLIGLQANAYPAVRADLERVTDLFKRFREQPASEHGRGAREAVRTALSPNDRLQELFHPLSSYVIVPLFALANAGVVIDGHLIAQAYASPLTVGIIVGYVVGKPVGITSFSWLVARLSRGRIHPPVGWASVWDGGTVAGIGFTVSLLIAALAFRGRALEEAKVGILTAGACASALAAVVFQATRMLPTRVRLRAMLGTAQPMVDLALAVDPERDHVRGPASAPVTLVEYGDFECPTCGQAEPVIRELLTDFGDLRYVWRHLPLSDVHPYAQLAAEASEAAGAQGRFWEMYDTLLAHQDALRVPDLVRYAEGLGLDVERFREELRAGRFAGRIADDVESADESCVSGTPTFFVNGRRHYGAYDLATLSADVRAARGRAVVAS